MGFYFCHKVVDQPAAPSHEYELEFGGLGTPSASNRCHTEKSSRWPLRGSIVLTKMA